MLRYLFPNQIIYLHKQIVAATGGSAGVRDKGLLESAVYRPQASFGGHDLYPDLSLKVAVLGHSIISNHPFVDGNKRTGYEAMRLMLRVNRHDIKAPIEEAYDFVMNIAKGELDERAIAGWIKEHGVPLK